MRIGIIGAKRSIDIVRKIILQNQLFIEPVYIEYSKYTEVVELVKKYEKEIDGILFTGATPFNYVSRFLQPRIPWEYLHRNQISLLSALLKGVYENNWGLSSISIDSYGEKIVKKTFNEIGCKSEDIELYIARFEPMEEYYAEKVYDFHLQNYMNKKVSFCITGIEDIYTLLQKNNVPVIKVNPASEVIVQQLNKLRLNHEIKMSEYNKIATVAIELSFQEEYLTHGKSELQIFRNKNEAREMIYVFAQRIGAAIFENTSNGYFLITTRAEIEAETQGFKSIDILKESIQNQFLSNVFIGIGLGENSLESKRNAELGCKKAMMSKMDCMFVVYDNSKIVGPITYVPKNEEPPEIDSRILKISNNTGVGITTLYKLEELIAQYNIDMITPKELARISGLTSRSINRLLVKLESGGYVKVVGKDVANQSGRPSRIIHIDFDK